jgi:hypothetical protein
MNTDLPTPKPTRGPKPGYKQTDEHRKNVSLAKKGVPLNPAQRAATLMQPGQTSLFKGRHHTAETKAKISAKNKEFAEGKYICSICKSKLKK